MSLTFDRSYTGRLEGSVDMQLDIKTISTIMSTYSNLSLLKNKEVLPNIK